MGDMIIMNYENEAIEWTAQYKTATVSGFAFPSDLHDNTDVLYYYGKNKNVESNIINAEFTGKTEDILVLYEKFNNDFLVVECLAAAMHRPMFFTRPGYTLYVNTESS